MCVFFVLIMIMNMNDEKNIQIEKVILEIVKEVKAIDENDIHQELLSEAQGDEDLFTEQMFEAGFESSSKEINDGDISDDMISDRRSEIEAEIIDSFIWNNLSHDDIEVGKYWVMLGDGEYIEIAEKEKEKIVEKIYQLIN